MKKGDMVECIGGTPKYQGMVGHTWIVEGKIGDQIEITITDENHRLFTVRYPEKDFRVVT